MPDKHTQIINKSFERLRRYEEEFYQHQNKLRDSFQSNVRAVKVERLISQCKAALENALKKNDEICSLADHTVERSKALEDLELWLKSITEAYDMLLNETQNYLQRVKLCVWTLEMKSHKHRNLLPS